MTDNDLTNTESVYIIQLIANTDFVYGGNGGKFRQVLYFEC